MFKACIRRTRRMEGRVSRIICLYFRCHFLKPQPAKCEANNHIDHYIPYNTMKSPSQTQNASIRPITLSNSMLQAALSRKALAPVLPTSTMATTSTSPESEALQRRRSLLMIIDSAFAILEGDAFKPSRASTTHQRPLQ
jgi:hypothetical protein